MAEEERRNGGDVECDRESRTGKRDRKMREVRERRNILISVL